MNFLIFLTAKPDENMVAEKQQHKETAPKRTWGSWAQALHQTAMHPDKHKDAVIEISDNFVVLNDLYPKVCFLYFASTNFLNFTTKLGYYAGKEAPSGVIKMPWS